MLTLKEWMQAVDYRITEGDDYSKSAYGDKAHFLSSWNGEHDGHSFSVIFDRNTQEVYEVQAHDYKHSRAYRMISPEYADAVKAEDGNNAWDDVDYTDLEVVDDWFEKVEGIRSGKDYDTRVSIPLDIPEDKLLLLFKAAHERDMTFNEFVDEALRHAIAEFDAGCLTKEDAQEFEAQWKRHREFD